jgi:hypothetical protein
VAGLLLEGRDEGPLPPDVAGVPATERDVQVRVRVFLYRVCRTYGSAGRAGAVFVCVACIAPDLAPNWGWPDVCIARLPDFVAGLLLEGRDEGPLPPDVSGVPATERDVQVRMRLLARHSHLQGAVLRSLCGLLPPDVSGMPATERDVQVRLRARGAPVCRTYVPAGCAGTVFACALLASRLS